MSTVKMLVFVDSLKRRYINYNASIKNVFPEIIAIRRVRGTLKNIPLLKVVYLRDERC